MQLLNNVRLLPYSQNTDKRIINIVDKIIKNEDTGGDALFYGYDQDDNLIIVFPKLTLTNIKYDQGKRKWCGNSESKVSKRFNMG